MTPFEQLISEREELWDSATIEIIQSIPNTINGVIGYLSQNEELSECQIAWRSIALLDGSVELMGSLIYPPGSTFTQEGQEPILVEEGMDDYFRRTLCLYLPLSLVLLESSPDVLKYLENVDENRKSVPKSTQKKPDPSYTGMTEKERIAVLMQAKNPDGITH